MRRETTFYDLPQYANEIFGIERVYSDATFECDFECEYMYGVSACMRALRAYMRVYMHMACVRASMCLRVHVSMSACAN